MWWTDVEKSFGNYDERKAEDLRRLKASCYLSKTIKCADLLDNLESVRIYDPDFYVVFHRRATVLTEALEGADPILLDELKDYLFKHFPRQYFDDRIRL